MGAYVDLRADPRVRQAYSTLVILCSAVGIAIVLMAGIAVILAPEATSASAPPRVVLWAFLLISSAAVTASVTLRRRLIASALRPAPSGPASSVGGASACPESPEVALSRIRTATIISCALAEVPATLGLVYLAIGGGPIWAPAFFGGALVAWALAFPRPSEWEEWLSGIEARSAGRGRTAEEPTGSNG